MPIPTTRAELLGMVTASFEKLNAELAKVTPSLANSECVDDWSIKDLLAVRAWWTESVLDWIDAGRRGEKPVTPAPGFGWSETPKLNAHIVKRAKKQSYKKVRSQIEQSYARLLSTIDELNDHELLDVGVFKWAGTYPVSRWLSINTARQYTTARTYIRRALKP